MTAGVILILNLLVFNNNIFFSFFCLLIFIIGFLSDLQIIANPIKKFLIQLIIVFFFFFTFDISISSTRIVFLDNFLQIKTFSIVFTIFCLLVLINGTNFIDGLNTLVVGYYLIILSIVLYLSTKNHHNINFYDFYYLWFSLVIIYFFNLFSKSYLGDSGSYLLSFVIGFYLIQYSDNNLYLLKPVSPIFILLLLWYPAFENLFSIIRRLKKKVHPASPDNYHLHQLLFIFIKSKFKKNTKINYINSISGNLINFYNLLIFLLASQYYNHTKYLAYFLILNISVYLFCYYLLQKFKSFK